MRILILSFYFPPDLSAGSFRNHALVRGLAGCLSEADEIRVLTTLPNRYHDFDVDALAYERCGVVHIHRFPLPTHRSGMIDQSRSFASYARAVMRYLSGGGNTYDLVYASSSRLMTAVLGAVVSKRLEIPFYADVRDIFSDTLNDVLPKLLGRIIIPGVEILERYMIRRASRVNLVSEGFLPYFRKRYPSKVFRIHMNGVDEEFLQHDFNSIGEYCAPRTLLYVGNIGESQGLHRIVPQLAGVLGSDWKIRLVGGGGALEKLKESVERARVENVEMLTPVERGELMELYRDATCLFLHLNAYDAFLKVLPSKIFEYAATGKPILAGVGGYAAEFLEREVENVGIFPPCDAQAGAKALGVLSLAHTPRDTFVERFRRDRIMEDMARDILHLA